MVRGMGPSLDTPVLLSWRNVEVLLIGNCSGRDFAGSFMKFLALFVEVNSASSTLTSSAFTNCVLW